MDIIAHTASIQQSKEALKKLRDNPDYTKLELDFHLTKDNKLVWSHGNKINGRDIAHTDYRNLVKVFVIEDVLELLDSVKPILLEIKGKPNEKQIYGLVKSMLLLVHYHNKIELESFNQDLIGILLNLKKQSVLDFIDYGLIINLFKTFIYRKEFPKQYKDISFVALSNELFEWPIVGKDYQYYREQLPHARQYAWSWDAVYEETEERISNYIVKGVDGIATSNPAFVKKLVK